RLHGERGTLDALAPAQVQADRLEGPFARRQFLTLKRRRLARLDALQIGPQVARVDLAPPLDVASRPHAEAEVRLVRPVNLVVPAAPSRPREAGNLVLLEAVRLQHVDGPRVHRQLLLFLDRHYLPALPPLPPPRPLLVG